VSSDTANVRSGPGTNYPSIGVLQQGDTVLVIATDADGAWYNILLTDGTTGWLAASVSEPVDQEAMGVLAVAATIPPPPPTPTPFTPTPETPAIPSGSGTVVVENQHSEKAVSVTIRTCCETMTSFSIFPGETVETVLAVGEYGWRVSGHGCLTDLPALHLGNETQYLTIVDAGRSCRWAVVLPNGEMAIPNPM
jgi:hypothetical protein